MREYFVWALLALSASPVSAAGADPAAGAPQGAKMVATVRSSGPPAKPVAPPAPPEAAAPMDIEEYVVDGNSVLDEAAVEQAVYPYLGPDQSPQSIEKARVALEKLYQSKGFQTVQVQAEDTAPQEGVVRLQVVELKIGRLRVVGSRYYSLSTIKRQAPSLKEGAVPNFKALQADVVTLNELPGRVVTPALRAGKQPGTIDVDLIVKDEFPLHYGVEINNQQSLATTPLRIAANASYDNLFQLGHRLSLNFQIAPQRPNDAEVFSGSYLARFLGDPYSIQINGIVSNSNVTSVGSTDVIGKGSIFGVTFLDDLPGTETFTQSLQLGVDWKDFSSDTQFLGAVSSAASFNPSAASNTASTVPASYFPITASYTATEKEDSAFDSATASLTFAPPRLGSSRAVIDNNRYAARGQDFYFRLALARTQDLPGGFDVDARLDGQLTDQPLISYEQFSLGGVRSVRGYFEAEKLVDSGFSGTLQLNSPSLPGLFRDADDKGRKAGASALDELHLFAFIDGGMGYIHSALPGQLSSSSLASFGFGADAKMFDHFSGALDWASPFFSTANTHANSQLILFRVSTEY